MLGPALLAPVLLGGALAVVACGVVTGRGVPGRVAALVGGDGRRRRILGRAAGTFVAYGGTSLAALLLIGRVDALWRMPIELRAFAWVMGLPAQADAAPLAWLAGTLIAGIVLGAALPWWHARRGRAAFGIGYRSPAEARGAGERLPAALLALAAGVGEELFFRLALPLLVALVTGSAALGFAVALVAFAALHRHQGRVGAVAVALAGVWLTWLYLLSGALWLVAALHAAIDLHALVIRPWAGDAGRRRS